MVSEEPCLKQLIDIYDELGNSVLGVQHVGMDQANKYGIVAHEGCVAEPTIKVKTLVEKPPVKQAPSDIAILGRYIIEPEIFDILENTPPGAGGEIQLTDALNVLALQKGMYAHIFQGKR